MIQDNRHPKMIVGIKPTNRLRSIIVQMAEETNADLGMIKLAYSGKVLGISRPRDYPRKYPRTISK